MMKQPGRRMPTRGQLALLASSLLVSFLALEAMARVWLAFFARPEQWQAYALATKVKEPDRMLAPHHYLNYYTKPGYRRRDKAHNSLGYRGSEFPVQKPEGEFRIAALGGSTTYCTTINDNDQTYPAQLERVLKNQYGYQRLRVINAGAPGYSSWETLINLEFRVLELAPDLVIVYDGLNDVHARFVQPDSYRSDNSGLRRQWHVPYVPWMERSCLLRILSRRLGLTSPTGVESFTYAPTALFCRQAPILPGAKDDPFVILQKNPPVYFQRNLTNMTVISRANGAQIMFATPAHTSVFGDYASFPYFEQGLRENIAVIKEVGQSQGVPVLDFAALMPADKEHWDDGRHVSPHGAYLQARLFAEFIHKNGLIGEK